ncbi:MAG: type II secretion system protein [Acidaminococcaceae bacterium]
MPKLRKGFTLIEIVVVLGILGILAGLAVPRFLSAQQEARRNTCLANRMQLARSYQLAHLRNPSLVLADFIFLPGTTYFAAVPRCPEQGIYSAVEEMVVCSLPAHGQTGEVASGLTSTSYTDFLKLLKRTLQAYREQHGGSLVGYDGQQLNRDLATANGGQSVQVDSKLVATIFGSTLGNTALYWHSDNGGGNVNSVVFAGTSANTHSTWQGYLVIVNGVLYTSTNSDSNNKRVGGNVAGLTGVKAEEVEKILVERRFVPVGKIT